MSTPATIMLKPKEIISRRYEEKRMSVAAYPGQLVLVAADDTYKPHDVNGGRSAVTILIEDALIGNTVSTQYGIGDLGRACILLPGDIFYGRIKAGANAAIGSQLVSNADGDFDVLAGAEIALTRAVEAVDNTLGGSPAYCKMEVI